MREVAREALARSVVDIERNFIVCYFGRRYELEGVGAFVDILLCDGLTGTRTVITVLIFVGARWRCLRAWCRIVNE